MFDVNPRILLKPLIIFLFFSPKKFV